MAKDFSLYVVEAIITRELWRTHHLVAADQPLPNLDGSS